MLTRFLPRTASSIPTDIPSTVASASDIVAERGGNAVLNGIDLSVRSGEVLSLVGPNGAGKSTLLAALSGDVPPLSGYIELYEAPLRSWSALDIARRQAVLPQAHNVSFPFTVADIVDMGRNPWAGTEAEDRDDELVEAAIERCDITHKRRQTFNTLSGGEKARVMLARIIAQDTGLVLLDEPTAALDLRHQEMVGRLVRELAEGGRGVLMVVHDLNFAAAYSDQIALMSQGRIESYGTGEDVLTPEAIGSVYEQDVVVTTHGGFPVVLPRRLSQRPGSTTTGFKCHITGVDLDSHG